MTYICENDVIIKTDILQKKHKTTFPSVQFRLHVLFIDTRHSGAHLSNNITFCKRSKL